ncbi:MAG: hypothetical protein ACM3O6_04525 [Acidobacteriota bacterium]|jgi:hypothetical protein
MPRMSLRALTRRGAADEIKPGDRYRRPQANHIVEMATVQGVRRDLLGIPHVMFKLVFECSDTNRFEEGSRILALSSFLELYRERIG